MHISFQTCPIARRQSWVNKPLIVCHLSKRRYCLILFGPLHRPMRTPSRLLVSWLSSHSILLYIHSSSLDRYFDCDDPTEPEASSQVSDRTSVARRGRMAVAKPSGTEAT